MVEDARKVFGKHARWYRTSPEHADQAVLSGLVCMVNPDTDSMVLDVATGTGNTAMAFAPFVKNVTGIDITPEMLFEAAEMSKEHFVQNLDLCMADVMTLPFPEATFDVVVSRRAPHHFGNIYGAIKEMSRVLKPGGVLAIDDRSVPEDAKVDATMNRLDELHDRSHVKEYRPSEWRSMISAANLEPKEMRSYVRNLPLTRLTGTAEATDAEEIIRLVASFDQEMKKKFGYRIVSGEVHINHWFVMLTAVKPVKPSF